MLRTELVIDLLFFSHTDQLQFAMEWVAGRTLACCEDRVRRDHWPSWLIQIVSGLEYIHSQGIVHNDLHLSNIMLTEAEKHIKLIDFGLSKLKGKDGGYSAAPEVLHSVKHKCPVRSAQPRVYAHMYARFLLNASNHELLLRSTAVLITSPQITTRQHHNKNQTNT